MPSVFTDEVGTYDLTITTAADWTITAADLPNGDSCASLSTTLNQNAVWAGEDFCLPNGSGSEVRTLEFWLKVSANTNVRYVAACRTNGTATTTTNRHWFVRLNADETLEAVWLNTTAGSYLAAVSSSLSAGWHHCVVEFKCGSSREINITIDRGADGSDTTTSGTATYATDATYEFYLGTSRTTATEEMTDRMAKVAWYERALSASEIADHYFAMVAT